MVQVGKSTSTSITPTSLLTISDKRTMLFNAKFTLSCRDMLIGAGGHYVIDSIAQLPLVVEEISQRLKSGETPSSARNDNWNLAFIPFDFALCASVLYFTVMNTHHAG